jgi:hypothetical protein
VPLVIPLFLENTVSEPACSNRRTTYDVLCELSGAPSAADPTGYGALTNASDGSMLYVGPQWRCYIQVPGENGDTQTLLNFYQPSLASRLGGYPFPPASIDNTGALLSMVRVTRGFFPLTGGLDATNVCDATAGCPLPAEQYLYTFTGSYWSAGRDWNALMYAWCADPYYVGYSGYQAITNRVNEGSSSFGYPIQSPYSLYPFLGVPGTLPYGQSVLLGAAYSKEPPVEPQKLTITQNPAAIEPGNFAIARLSLLCCRRPPGS